MIIIDEQTDQRVLSMPYVGDIEYNLTGDTAISNETVPVIGNWTDYTGSAIVDSRQQMFFTCTENELWGQRPAITENIKIPNLNEIGERSGTTRRRVIKKYKEL